MTRSVLSLGVGAGVVGAGEGAMLLVASEAAVVETGAGGVGGAVVDDATSNPL